MTRRNYSKFYILGSLIAIIALLIFFNSLGWLNWPKRIIYGLSASVFRPFETMGANISGTLNFISGIKNLARDNSSLKQENEELTSRLAQSAEIEEENKALREQLQVAPPLKSKIVLADLVGFDPTNFDQYFFIDRGKNDGVEAGQAVIFQGNFLIGKVIDVQPNLSKVLSLVDSDSSVFSLSQETRVGGVVRGDHGVGLFLDMVAPEENIKVGETVITSGLDGRIPKGLIIGQIESKISQESDVFQKFKVKPAVNYKEAESVFVVLGNE